MGIIKLILQFVFLCGIVLGVVGTIFMRSCWDNTGKWSDQTIQNFYADGGPHDQIVNEGRQDDARIRREEETHPHHNHH
jgi:hypothetical protein